MMKAAILGLALFGATLGAACTNSDPGSLSSLRSGNKGTDGTSGTDGPTGTSTGAVATNSPQGKAFYEASVHPILKSVCGACHSSAGPGPAWFTPSDPEASYAQLFQAGYVIQNSRITTKPAHGGSTTNVLSADQIATYNKWVSMEIADGGKEAPPNILAKLGDCFDKTKFDDMKLGDWRTTQRTKNNNTNNVTNWNENANNCTGCNNSPCSTCHSADDATGFSNAVGNTILPEDTTFNNTKLTTPPYITKYFGVSPDGKAIASDAIKKKSDSTKLATAYSHPMFTLTDDQQTAVDAFVQDVITKFTAGTCGK
jgi:mono/diheme cytochrome c family protein